MEWGSGESHATRPFWSLSSGFLVGWLLACLLACLLAWLLSCLVAFLLSCLRACLLGWLVGFCWLLACSVGRLVAWLVACLLACLVATWPMSASKQKSQTRCDQQKKSPGPVVNRMSVRSVESEFKRGKEREGERERESRDTHRDLATNLQFPVPSPLLQLLMTEGTGG